MTTTPTTSPPPTLLTVAEAARQLAVTTGDVLELIRDRTSLRATPPAVRRIPRRPTAATGYLPIHLQPTIQPNSPDSPNAVDVHHSQPAHATKRHAGKRRTHSRHPSRRTNSSVLDNEPFRRTTVTPPDRRWEKTG